MSSSLFSSLSLPPLLSLFSSSTFPHPLWQSQTDPLLPEDSLLLHFPSDSSFLPSPSTPLPKDAALVHTSSSRHKKGAISHPAVHIQSPNVKTTFLRFPDKRLNKELGLGMEWIHFVLKPLGGRELVVEVGVKDGRGFRGVVRTSTFTTTSHLSTSTLSPTHSSSSSPSPLFLLPLILPPKTSSTLTPWFTLSLSLSSLLSHFSTLASTTTLPPGSSPLPTQMRGATWSYVKIYANCRVRRVWASLEQGGEGGGRGREELGVWGVEGEDEEEED